MNIAFITPTKDRPAEIANMLESFAAQTRRPNQVIVLDASAEPVQAIVGGFSDRLPVRYVRWEGRPSAAAQRNAGIAHVAPDADLVCFFDDDQILHPDALERMLDFWATAGPETGGAAFNQANWDDRRSDFIKRSWLAERLGLYSRRPGAVAPSGWQSLYGWVKHDLEVQWLSSQALVLRRRVLDEFRFDEFFDGYSYLEDLDFSYSVSRQYRLHVVAGALFEHYHSASGRIDAFRFGRVEARNRLYFVRKHRLSLAACCAALAIRGGFSLADGILHANRQGFMRLAGNLAGIAAGFRHAPHSGRAAKLAAE